MKIWIDQLNGAFIFTIEALRANIPQLQHQLWDKDILDAILSKINLQGQAASGPPIQIVGADQIGIQGQASDLLAEIGAEIGLPMENYISQLKDIEVETISDLQAKIPTLIQLQWPSGLINRIKNKVGAIMARSVKRQP